MVSARDIQSITVSPLRARVCWFHRMSFHGAQRTSGCFIADYSHIQQVPFPRLAAIGNYVVQATFAALTDKKTIQRGRILGSSFTPS